LMAWVLECETFLDEFLQLEGRGDHASQVACISCKACMPLFQCRDCQGMELCCSDCCIKLHLQLPFHCVKQWVDTHFIRVMLKSLGLFLQLDHTISDHCCNPKHVFRDEFIVIDTSSIHDVALDFCGCRTAQTHVKQLLCARLFPATIFNLKTAATFKVLEKYQLLSFKSKASSYEYYQCLVQLTDNVSINPPKDQYPSFLHVVHEWRHLKMLKCAGQGHYPNGIESMHEGQCALLCPACPQLGKNLPTDWHCATPKKQFVSFLCE
ncbi:hypothetical protein SCLCIDRAFT_112806, partial [Scleroderma citrinum Foug A]